jgi:hypothetical protein
VDYVEQFQDPEQDQRNHQRGDAVLEDFTLSICFARHCQFHSNELPPRRNKPQKHSHVSLNNVHAGSRQACRAAERSGLQLGSSGFRALGKSFTIRDNRRNSRLEMTMRSMITGKAAPGGMGGGMR